MHFVKIETSDGETRWINLARVSRVTSVVEAGREHETLVLIFADGDDDTTLKIKGSQEQDRKAIAHLRAAFDRLVEGGQGS